MTIQAWGSVQNRIIDAVETAKSMKLATESYDHGYSVGYAEAKRDVLLEIAKAFEELNLGMTNLELYAKRYAWLRDGNGYRPEEEFARGGEDLDTCCDDGIKEDADGG